MVQRKFFSAFTLSIDLPGSFFVYSRVAEPFHSIFINNRLNTNSLVEPITKQIELQSQPPFLLYRNQRSAISGFWFYSREDNVRIHSLLETLIKKCNNAQPGRNEISQQIQVVEQQPQPRPGFVKQPRQGFVKQHNGHDKKDVDIFSMLSKAQEDFNKSGVPPTGAQMDQRFAAMQINNPPKQQQIPHEVLTRQLSNAMPDITPDITSNVMNFFAAAQQPNGVVPVKADVQKIQSQNKPFINANHSVAPVQTLDEIEKQHRVSASPPQQKIGKTMGSAGVGFITHRDVSLAEPKMVKTDFNNLLNSVAQQQKQTISPQPMMKLPPQGAFIQTQPSGKPTLITPAMFQATNAEEKGPIPQSIQSNIRPEPLTQNQLLQALNYMLETDPEFIRKVHEAYVKSFNRIVSL